MGEPTLDERRVREPSPQPTKPGLEGDRRSPIQKRLRGKTFAEGEHLLRPSDDAPVQMKPKPDTPKSPGKEKGEVETLREENAELRGENEGLKVKNEEQDTLIDELVQSRDAETHDTANKHLLEALAKIEDATGALKRLEAFIEGLLVADTRRQQSDKEVDGAIKAYQDAQAPGLLEMLTLIVNVAAAVKSVGQFFKNATAKALAGKGGKLVLGGSVVDAGAAGAAAAGAIADRQSAQETSRGGDAVVGMVAALDAKIDSVQGNIELLSSQRIADGLAEISSGLNASMRQQSGVLSALGRMRRKPAADLQARLDEGAKKIESETIAIHVRLQGLTQLASARTNGPSQLAKGSTGRQLFDLVAKQPNSFTMHEETQLLVGISIDNSCSVELIGSDRWLECSDAVLSRSLAQVEDASKPLSRPAWASRDYVHLETEQANPLLTLGVVCKRQPQYSTAKVSGRAGTEVVARSVWEDPTARQQLMDSLGRAPMDPKL